MNRVLVPLSKDLSENLMMASKVFSMDVCPKVYGLLADFYIELIMQSNLISSYTHVDNRVQDLVSYRIGKDFEDIVYLVCAN